MSAEFWAIIGVGVSLALLLYQFTGGIRGELADIRERLSHVEQRLSRVEGMLEVMRDFIVGKQPTT